MYDTIIILLLKLLLKYYCLCTLFYCIKIKHTKCLNNKNVKKRKQNLNKMENNTFTYIKLRK